VIIQSLIQDESTLTLDCAKAKLIRGSRIEIADIHWASKEVQGAVSLGLVEIVGQIPSIPEKPKKLEPEKTVRFRNAYKYKLAFECIKGSVGPDELISIPVSKLEEEEVRNAISAGWLFDEDNPAANWSPVWGPPALVEEVTVTEESVMEPKAGLRWDNLDSGNMEKEAAKEPVAALPPKYRQADAVPATRPKPKAGPIKAKPITSVADRDDGGVADLYSDSKIIVPENAPPRRSRPIPMDVEADDSDSDSDFSDIFPSLPARRR
jgi:hypothetical protein